MRFFTHIAAGLLLYTILVWILNQPYTLAGIMFVVMGSLIPDLIDKATGDHRGWGHSVIWLIPSLFLFAWNTPIALAFTSGFIMHILFDALTKKGVPFLYPFSKTRIVMPKKEKSRIQTGHKKEIALFLVVILVLIPISYGVIHGFPEIPGLLSKNNTNSTNKTNATPYTFLSSDYRSPSSYSTNSTPTSTKSAVKNSGLTDYNSSIIEDLDLDKDLLDWLDDNPTGDSTTNNQTNNQATENQTNFITDALFGDLSFDNLPEGQQFESEMSMDEDTTGFLSDESSTANDNLEYYDSYDDFSSDDAYDDYYMGLFSILITAGGGLIGKM